MESLADAQVICSLGVFWGEGCSEKSLNVLTLFLISVQDMCLCGMEGGNERDWKINIHLIFKLLSFV